MLGARHRCRVMLLLLIWPVCKRDDDDDGWLQTDTQTATAN
jgi:hypothetical protein